jgi:hypothetical protein
LFGAFLRINSALGKLIVIVPHGRVLLKHGRPHDAGQEAFAMKIGFISGGCRVRRRGQSITTILGGIMLLGAGWLSGATFDVWLVIPSGPISSNTGFAVEVWGEMHGMDAIGLSDFAVTVASTKTGFVQPQAAAGQFIAMSWGEEMWRFALKIPAARSDLEGDGDADAVQFAAGDKCSGSVGQGILDHAG